LVQLNCAGITKSRPSHFGMVVNVSTTPNTLRRGTRRFTALIPARNGINVTLFEANNDIDHSPRHMVFQPCALAEIVEAGIYDQVQKDSAKNAVISWWRAGFGSENTHLATIATAERHEPFLTGLNCAQSEFTRILLTELEKEETATVNLDIGWLM
jgi:2-polyprenyl-6-methoxyphenol hydroxylase-like FAD-dependent oxidoreductase